MKKLLLSVMTFFLMGSLSAQNVARECVLFEVFTGVNCPYCPAAANGIAQMLEEGLAIAPMGYQTSAFSVPEFYTSETNARASYYNISSYPTAKVDGVYKYEGGGTASQSLYNQYKNYYNQRINVTSPFTIDLSFDYYGGTQCQATAVVTKVGECNGTNVRVFMVLTESHIKRNWQGMTELNCVVRDMIPNQQGTAWTGDSDTQTVTGLFDMSGFNKENCQLIAWVQSYAGTKEVYQAVKMNVAETSADYDLGIQNVEGATPGSCSGMLKSRFEIKNFGEQDVTSVDFITKDENENQIAEYTWNGSLAKGESTIFEMPEVDFNGAQRVVIEAANINGNHNDEYRFDNFFSMNVSDAYIIEDGYLKVSVKSGKDPENFSIKVIDQNSGEVVKTFTYEEASHTYQDEYILPGSGCYCLAFRHEKGLGMNGGFYEIKDSKGNKIIYCKPSDDVFDYVYNYEINYSLTDVNEASENESFVVYPNPVSSEINVNGNYKNIDIYNSLGQLVYSKCGDLNNCKINAEAFDNGLYVISLTDVNGNKSSQKIVIGK